MHEVEVGNFSLGNGRPLATGRGAGGATRLRRAVAGAAARRRAPQAEGLTDGRHAGPHDSHRRSQRLLRVDAGVVAGRQGVCGATAGRGP